jgi:hypothetical protein
LPPTTLPHNFLKGEEFSFRAAHVIVMTESVEEKTSKSILNKDINVHAMFELRDEIKS